MPKAIEVAAELHKLADSLEKGGDAFVERPHIYMSYAYGGDDAKDHFLVFAKLMPKPIEKKYDAHDMSLVHETPSIWITSRIERSKVCTLIEPAREAVYDCEPLLSAEESEAL